MTILVIDVGTSGVRAAAVDGAGRIIRSEHREVLPTSPAPSFVEFDPTAMATAALELARAVAAEAGPIRAVGIANQRASTILWDRATGQPAGPGVGWQDLRTVGMCLMLRPQGIRLAPNASATKLAFLLDMADPGRERDLCFGTVDTWIAWHLSEGAVHVTDASNAAVTGLVHTDGSGWDDRILEALNIPRTMLPEIVDSTGALGAASALPGAPPISGIAGDQQASLIGQSCVAPGQAKITFGTGGMLDLVAGPERPGFEVRGGGGSFPIIAWRQADRITWGVEAVMLSAGSAVEWLRDDMQLLADSAESEAVAAGAAPDHGVWFVPALLGLGTPAWDFGARGTLLGLTRGSGRAEIVRAVLEGVAHRGADLVESAETDSGHRIAALRVDGGMTANSVFLQALADATQRPVEVSPVLEATTLGAAYLAGLATGVWSSFDEVGQAWRPSRVVEPGRPTDRDRWREAVERAKATVPELSALEF